MPLIHKLTIAALAALVLTTAAMLVQHGLSAARLPTETSAKALQQKAFDDIVSNNKKIFAQTEQLLQTGRFDDARQSIDEIRKQHPDNPQSFVYLARIQMKEGRIGDAIHSYRIAIEMEPAYTDKNTPLYIGTVINDILPEARTKLNREKKLKPGDASIKARLEDVYYLQRRIAGGCE